MELYFTVFKSSIREYLSELSFLRFCLAGIIALVYLYCIRSNKRNLESVLSWVYFVLLLLITVLGRKWFTSVSSIDTLWTTYQVLLSKTNPFEIYEVVNNILLFVPAGWIVVSSKNTQLKNTIPLIFLISLSIETIQTITGTGLFEICDLIDNTLGGTIGIVLYKLWRTVKTKWL